VTWERDHAIAGVMGKAPSCAFACSSTVTFPAELVPELHWHLERFAQPGERGLVFAGPKGAALRRSNFRPIWNTACHQAGMPGLHFHDLRHVGGTLAAATRGEP
jgi:integrase